MTAEKPTILPEVLSVLTKVTLSGQSVIHGKKPEDQESSDGKRDSADENHKV